MASETMRNPDDRTEADAAFRNGPAHFALAERAAKIGYWRHDLVEDRITWSPGMYNLLGVDPATRPADTAWLLDQVVAEDVAELRQKITAGIKTRSPFYYRSRAKDPNAPAKIVDTHGEVEIGPDGRVVTVIGICHDVTEQVAAETARRHAEEMYRVVAEQASDIIILYDAEGHIQYASEALHRVLKRAPDEIDDQRFLDLVHPEDLDEAIKLTAELEPGETLTATYRARHGDGHYVWIEATVRAICDESGAIKSVIGVSRDITERKLREIETTKARDRAEAANMAKSAFLANMSHELRTPLNAIIGFADVMRQNMFGPVGATRYEEYIRLIHESGQLLLDLISDVLDMAKIEAGKLELSIEQVNLHAVMQQVANLLRERAQQTAVNLTVEMPEGDVTLEADRRAIKQILLNLLSNAIKFTLAGGNITVRALHRDGEITIQVEDDGIGIPASEVSRLGQPFEQACADPTLSKGGTGLGLALVFALAERHGGKARIESELGIGTIVSVELPAEQDGARHCRLTARPAPG
jgi:PAS domain S-box-containing protein